MMQNTLDSVTSPTYSLNEHAIKLNSSSIASSTPECSGQLLVFEEYPECQEKLKGGMKRNLRILIEEDFDYGKDMQEVGEREEGGWSDSQRKQ